MSNECSMTQKHIFFLNINTSRGCSQCMKGQIRSINYRTCMKRCINVKKARQICKYSNRFCTVGSRPSPIPIKGWYFILKPYICIRYKVTSINLVHEIVNQYLLL